MLRNFIDCFFIHGILPHPTAGLSSKRRRRREENSLPVKHLQRLTLLAQRRRSCQKSASQGSVRSFSELHTQMQSTMCMHSVQYGILYRYKSYTDNVQGIFQPHSQVLSQPHSQDTSFPALFPGFLPLLHAVKGPCKHLCDHIWVDRSDTLLHTGHPRTHLCCMRTG